MAINNTNPPDIKLADRVQLGLLPIGDGFFPLKGSVKVNGITRTIKSLIGEIVPGTGMQVKVRDYVALIDGIIITDKNKEQLEFTAFTNVALTGSGVKYITLRANTYTGYDGIERPDSDKGILEVSSSSPLHDSGKILVGVVVIPTGTTQITTDMIDNAQRDYLGSLEDTATNLPPDLLQRVSDLETRMTAVENQVLSGFIVDHQVDSSDLDPASTVAINVDGNFTLPTNQALVYLQDTFTGADFSSIDTSKFNAGPRIFNNKCQLLDAVTDPLNVFYTNLYSNVSAPITSTISYDMSFKSNASIQIFGANSYMRFLSNREQIVCSVAWSPSGDPINVTVISQDYYTGFSCIYATVHAADVGITGNAYTGGMNFNLSWTLIGTSRQIKLNGIVVGTGDSDWDCSGVNDTIFLIAPDNTYNGTTEFYVDNMLITSPTAGAYGTSGVMLTKTLPHSMSIARAAAGWVESLPAGTTVAMEFSLDGGSHWQSMTNGALKDGTVAPWNGTGTDFRLRATLTTSNQTLSPVLGPVVASSSRI